MTIEEIGCDPRGEMTDGGLDLPFIEIESRARDLHFENPGHRLVALGEVGVRVLAALIVEMIAPMVALVLQTGGGDHLPQYLAIQSKRLEEHPPIHLVSPHLTFILAACRSVRVLSLSLEHAHHLEPDHLLEPDPHPVRDLPPERDHLHL